MTRPHPQAVEETGTVHIGSTPGEQYGWECAGCDTVTGLQFGSRPEAESSLQRHLEGCPDETH